MTNGPHLTPTPAALWQRQAPKTRGGETQTLRTPQKEEILLAPSSSAADGRGGDGSRRRSRCLRLLPVLSRAVSQDAAPPLWCSGAARRTRGPLGLSAPPPPAPSRMELNHELPRATLNAIKIDLMTSADMEKLSSISIVEVSDVTSPKLGLPNGSPQCETCGSQSERDCDGHFGVTKLAATVHNPYFIDEVVHFLNQICPGCLSPRESIDLKRLGSEPVQTACKYCSKDGSKLYPSVIFKTLSSPRVLLSKSRLHRSTSVMERISIVAEATDRVSNKSKGKGLLEGLPQDYWDFVPSENQQLQSTMTKIILSPYQVFHMLKKSDPELIKQFVSRRELLFLSCLPVTPNCHRVVEIGYGLSDARLTFDDRTKAYKRMVDVSRRIDDYRQHPQFSVLASSLVSSRVSECLKSSKLYSRKTEGETTTDTYGMKWLKDAVLSKRSDNAFRSIMVGDPKIRLWEIGIPEGLASNLVVSEPVSTYNLENMNLKCNLHLLAKEELFIRRNGKLMFIRKANQLEVGDIAYRPLQDGDLILINRPPSVHQHSLIALSTKILPIQSVVSINPLCCTPFLGDFDGDCLHGYIPQSIRSRIELGELVSLHQQLLNMQDGRSLVSLTHDSLAAAHLLTSADIFLKKSELQQLQMLCLSVSDTPVPAVVKSMDFQSSLWTDLYMFSDHYSRRKLTEGVKLALDEAEEAFRIKQILLDPINIPVLKCHDETEDVTYRQSDYILNNLSVVRSSIMAFKDVFSDLLKMVQQHVSNDNSMMVMINAGSKGSMLKYAQQTACVGLQLPASKFPFRIPSELSCISWNEQKSLSCEAEGNNGRVGGQNLYAVIRHSFIEGLNPLECLLHAISGRANFFSEHADVPGTLTRKLMYHLRDLHVAYDGTVRSSYGQHITQFSYDTADDMYCNRDRIDEIGAPVGSWAASSVSEAAYGALDHPVNGLEDSPLMNLQEVFKCHKGTNSGDHVGLLFLSKHLKKYRYGLEYASLEVKNHLERVNFSDLVEIVMIIYDGCDTRRKGGPWTTHFHISKEMMKKKRLGLGFVVEELTKEYDTIKNQLNNAIPSVCISKRKCSVGDECVQNSTCCITVVAQAESNSMSQLDIIKKRVIPIILDTLLKGFLEFKDVEIQCRHDGELLVKVGMSEHCKAGRFWATLQNACIPVMELIDWEQSRPKNVYDIFCSYGIDSAWKCFVEYLKSVTADIGRNVRREHLLVVADCLSVTGQFHALSSQGLKQQRTLLSISSPFSEACFSRPAQSFINAAKQCSVDNLCGSLDAIAWGKEPFNGTSGPFEIMHVGKPHEPEENESIYGFLCDPEVRNFEKNHMDTCRHSTENSLRCRLACKYKGNATINGGDITIDQGFLQAKVGIWDNIIDMRTSLQNMLREYPLNGYVMEPDKSLLVKALKFHPKGAEKIGVGVKEIKIGLNPSHPGTRCFILLRNDDTTEDFSYNKCVQGAANSISPQLGSYFEKKLYLRG
ncbi:DNA-directed RNA polymerase IV subunit 1-like isoform X3 [Panicum virgatum]|uniref:DNA-directed RNA polymerase IV subunit 1-like isoform X3 n=1 Tax=Panicum virgatum TaxID=38727 RepID=UPI0019D4FD20|nr:DNA-directed RNA polymerase IV subunit 1-like isoform X3 [Panicum virgatum]